ncbi:hypothetical protein RJ639_045322 [Escallonia herrerae]|uniref:RRM domain-containing protein n=1 Tax=Escallonia herrerae TaxID=1293975 RepID=A0AA89AZ73_9ASTE|nr:hypothetical protein RJ639_045322 [Escallonia herrerae]
MRGRSYSYSLSPPRYRSRRPRSPSPRGRYGGRARDLPTSLLVRNLHHDCRPEDLHRRFEEFGPLKDVYLLRDYYSGEPRGFGFVQYVDPADAEEAKYYMDGQVLLGRELTVVFAEENRKKPHETRSRDRFRGCSYDRRRSPPRRYGRSYSRSPSYYSPSPRRGHYSRYVVSLCQFHLEIDTADIERGHTRGHLMAQGAGARSGVGALIRGDMHALIPCKQGFVKEKGAKRTCDDQSRIAWARQQRSVETQRRSMYSRVLCCFTTSTHLLHSSAHEHPAPAAADGAPIRLLIPLLYFDDGEQHTTPPITDLP